MLIDKFNRIILSALPEKVRKEIEQIATETDNFSDEELIGIYEDNFNELFALIEKKHPTALRAKDKLLKPKKEKLVATPKKKKLLKKVVEKQPVVKKGKLIKKKEAVKPKAKFNIDDEVVTHFDQKGLVASKTRSEKFIVKRVGKVQKITFNKDLETFTYNVKGTTGFFLADEDKLSLKGSESKAADSVVESADPDLSGLKGKEVIWYLEGDKEGTTYKIDAVKITDKKYDHREFVLTITGNEYRFDLDKLEGFLGGSQLIVKGEKHKAAIELKDNSHEDCVAALAQIKVIKDKREAAAKKRAEAPKKKVSTAVREKQTSAIMSTFKTKQLKDKKEESSKFAADLFALYRKHGFESIATQMEKDVKDHLEKHYAVKKLKAGGELLPAKKSLIDELTDFGIDLDGEDETSVASFRMELEDSIDNDAEFNEHVKSFEEDWLEDISIDKLKKEIQESIEKYKTSLLKNK